LPRPVDALLQTFVIKNLVVFLCCAHWTPCCNFFFLTIYLYSFIALDEFTLIKNMCYFTTLDAAWLPIFYLFTIHLILSRLVDTELQTFFNNNMFVFVHRARWTLAYNLFILTIYLSLPRARWMSSS
jgi:hypothetical protein